MYYIDPTLKSDCELLVDRMLGTIKSVKPSVLNQIKTNPGQTKTNDIDIFEGLCMAILSNQSPWDSVIKHYPQIKTALYNFNFNVLANMTNAQLSSINFPKIPSRIQNIRKLIWIRDDAKVFQSICNKNGSVYAFIKLRNL